MTTRRRSTRPRITNRRLHQQLARRRRMLAYEPQRRTIKKPKPILIRSQPPQTRRNIHKKKVIRSKLMPGRLSAGYGYKHFALENFKCKKAKEHKKTKLKQYAAQAGAAGKIKQWREKLPTGPYIRYTFNC